MKKLFGGLFLLGLLCLPSFAEDFSTVCASHILVPTELEAIKLKNEIKSLSVWKKWRRFGMFWKRPDGKTF